MEPREMLEVLDEIGADAGADFNDGDDVNGWFGWSLMGDQLVVTHTPVNDDGDRPGEAVSHAWRLVPVS